LAIFAGQSAERPGASSVCSIVLAADRMVKLTGWNPFKDITMRLFTAARLSIGLIACLAIQMPSKAQAAGPFDGTYVGTTTNTTMGKGTQGCVNATRKTITVKDGVFEYVTTSTSTHQEFHDKLPVGPDGSFKGTVGNAGQMSGTFTATGMTGEWAVLACLFKMDFKKG
jgi:hypothetical protein